MIRALLTATALLTFLVLLAQARPPATEPATREAKTIDFTRSGTYVSGSWKFVYQHLDFRDGGGPGGTIQGALYYDGRKLEAGGPHNDSSRPCYYHDTPWGPMYSLLVSEHSGGGTTWALLEHNPPIKHLITPDIDFAMQEWAAQLSPAGAYAQKNEPPRTWLRTDVRFDLSVSLVMKDGRVTRLHYLRCPQLPADLPPRPRPPSSPGCWLSSMTWPARSSF